MKNQFQIYKKWLVLGFLVISFLGFLDAAYLAVKYYFNAPVACSIFEKCDKVLMSQYAVIAGVPVALLGAAYYFAIFLLAIIYLYSKQETIISFAAKMTFIGFLVSFWLVYLQFFVIQAICFYCIVSAAASTILFIFGLFVIKLQRSNYTL